ncbi:MAG: AMP-binding protein [Myxococcota bacterium]|nr:AMP-binding protein [Myxococcota bacterium]
MTEALRLTLPGRLLSLADEKRTAVALREKELGVWREYSWQDYLEMVSRAALSLSRLNVSRGDHVAILSENRTEWLFADLAAQGLGARSVGIYQTNTTQDVAYVLSHSQSRIVFCEDQEQVDKVLAADGAELEVDHIIVFDPRGLRYIEDPRLMTWLDFLGECSDARDRVDWFRGAVLANSPDEAAMVVYTSGTTGPPKGALLTGRNALAITDELIEQMGMGDSDSLLSYLPLCHVAEKIFTYFLPLTTGAVVHFGESIDTVRQDLVDVSPTVFLGVPRIWEKMHASIQLKMKDASWLKRTLYAWAVNVGMRVEENRRNSCVSNIDRVLWWCGDLLVFRPLQERMGLRRCQLAYSGAAPISKDLLTWFHGIGVRIYEGYGQTESGGLLTINLPGFYKLGSVGRVIPNTELKFADDGEILARGTHIFPGYLKNADATATTIDSDGWLKTGDIGRMDEEGYVFITGRKKEIIITAGGKNLSPEKIENALKMSPYIKEAIAIGDKRKFISALVQIDQDAAGDWAIRREIPFTSFEDLTSKDEITELIKSEIQSANDALVRVEQVRAFRLLPKELHQDDGEMTATQKVKRAAVCEKFEALITDMYGP